MKWPLLSLGLLLLSLTVVPWLAGLPLLAALAVIVGVGLATPQRAAVRRSWRGMLRLPLLLPLVLLPLLGGLFLGTPGDRPAGAPLSPAGLLIGTWLALRLLALFLAGAVLTAHVSPYTVARALERLGLHGLGFALGLALNALPAALRAVSESWQALRLRGGLRHSWWRGLRLFLINATVRVVCQGEETLLAAQLRGHGLPERTRPGRGRA